MSKKYLSLEEAAQALGLSVDELKRIREKGDIRGFADRATWKFREQDIEEYRRRSNPDSSPEVSIMGDDDIGLGDEPAVDDDSASDVRLILDDDLLGDDSAPEVPAAGSDSDVQLVGGGSDSDVKLVDSGDSSLGGSDSDVRLVEPVGSASDSNVLVGEDRDEDGLTLAAGSSILGGEDSGISLEAADSGISLEAADSGISLESLDSSINLSNESSAEFELGGSADDSGISLSADDGDEVNRTMAMDSFGEDDDLDDTKFEIESAGSSEYEITGLGENDQDDDDDTSVLLLDDEDESSESSATMVGGGDDDFESEETFDLGEDEGDEFDDFEMEGATVAGDDDELDDLDVFDAVDEDFDDDFGDVSQGEFAAPVGMRMPAVVEPEWGTGMFIGVLVSSILMAVCGLMMIDLVRSMWSYQGPAPYNSALLDMFKGMLN